MKTVDLNYRLRGPGVRLFALLLAAVMLFGNGCRRSTGDDGTDTNGQPTTGTDEPVRPIADLSEYDGLVISKVYGNGGSGNSACDHCFVELTNTGDTGLDLLGLSLYYRSGALSDYVSFRLPDVRLGAGASFLIRGARSSESPSSRTVIRIDECDAEWDVTLSSSDIKLVLAPTGAGPDGAVPPEEFENMISYFAAVDSYRFDTGYVSGLSKNKMAVRTAMVRDSGYYLQNLTKSTTEKLEQIVPVTSDGKRGVVVRSMLDEVRFSSPAGFYAEPIELELFAPEGYDKIYYTIDGSDPATSATKKEYTGAIALDDTTNSAFGRTYVTGLKYVHNIASPTKNMIGAHVIKARAFNGKDYTGVYTNSYFVSPKMSGFGVTVMSVTLEKEQMFGDPGFYHNFNASSNDPNTRGAAFMEVFDENGSRRGYSNVELAISGHGSSGTGMRSMKVFYKGSGNKDDGAESKLNYDLFKGYATNSKGQRITDFSRLLLRNSGNDCGNSYIRDAYMQRVSRSMYVDTMAYAPVLVFINGDFWGVYNARERYSGDYVQSHYGIDKDNVALLESDYSQVHTNQNAPFIVSSGLENDADDFNELVDFIRGNSLEDESNYEYVCGKIDIDSLIDLFVSRIYFSALDFPGNNIKVWRNRADDDPSGFDNKWHFVMLDMDMGISFYRETTENSNCFGWVDSAGTVASSIVRALRRNKKFNTRFLSRFYQVLKEVYEPSFMEAELDGIVEGRSAVTDLLTQRWGADKNNYTTAVAAMRRFVQNRYDYALSYLCSYFRVTEDYLISIGGNYLSVNFPETRLNVSVNGEAIQSPRIERFDESVSVTVTAEAKEGFELIAIVFTDVDGKVSRFTGGKADITTGKSGDISFETKKLKRQTELTVRSGIVAGGCQMFYLAPDGKLYAWGSNSNNVLGAGVSKALITEPKLVKEGVAQVEICHGNDMENNNDNVMAAILTLDSEIYTIGAATVPGVTPGRSSWAPLDFDGVPVEISVGYDHLLVLNKDGSVWGIGNNSYGQLGKEDEGGSVTKFRKIADGAVMISAGRRNTAFIDKNGDCYIMGDGRWHKFRESEENITTPYKLLSGVSYISSGEHELLMVTEDGGLYYAGWRSVIGFSQGGGSRGAQKLDISGVTKASIHHSNIAILTESGALYVYGTNVGGCIGGAVTGGAPEMMIRSGVKDVAAGYAFIAYIASDGSVTVNGSNSEGQAGNGRISDFESHSVVKIK